MRLKKIKFTDITGIEVGHSHDKKGGTGCSVIICPNGGVGGVDVRGGAPATRETDLLRPENHIQKIHGIVLSGGSAFGLDSASGVMEYLENRDIGFDVGVTKVPIVVGASLFDLSIGDMNVRPDKKMGLEACNNISKEDLNGNIGAGTGATIGKIFGKDQSMKSGLGTYAFQIGELQVGAMVAVNALGDVVDPATGTIIGGVHDNKGSFLDTEKILISMAEEKGNISSGNTTIGAVVTNGRLDKAQMNKLSSMAHNGYGRTIRPVHTTFDGDTIFSLSTGKVETDLNVVATLAIKAIEQAIINAVKFSEPAYGLVAADIRNK